MPLNIAKLMKKYYSPPSNTNSTSDEVIIYSNVRNKTIHLAMNTQFERIENMMFVNTIYELDTEDNSFEQDEDCD